MNSPVIDFHAHVGAWGAYTASDDPKDYIRIMDAAGIDKTCVNSIWFGDTRRNNDLAHSFARDYPDRFVFAAYVTPRYPDEAMRELERCFGELDAKFLKIYPTFLTKPIDHPSYFPIFDWCNERGIVLMCHSQKVFEGDYLTHPARFGELAVRYSRVKWVLAHSGNAMMGQEESVKAAKGMSNMYLETCTSMAEHGTVEYLVDGVGEDRVLYGSDMPLLDARTMISRVATADISDEAKRKILGLNAVKLLGLQGP